MAALCRSLCRSLCYIRSNSTLLSQDLSILTLPRYKGLNFTSAPLIRHNSTAIVPEKKEEEKEPKEKINTSETCKKLMQFFDEEKNWDESSVQAGRAWNIEDLRIKSNEDLHKLWFVLLKERNMLLTMQHACKEECELMPNEERVDKVEISMENLEKVVRERNRAYYLLETGETGERPGKYVKGQLGIQYFYRQSEHIIPEKFNGKWREVYKFGYGGKAVHKFLRLLREKNAKKKRFQRRCAMSKVTRIMEKFPDVDKELLRERYPEIKIFDKLVEGLPVHPTKA